LATSKRPSGIADDKVKEFSKTTETQSDYDFDDYYDFAEAPSAHEEPQQAAQHWSHGVRFATKKQTAKFRRVKKAREVRRRRRRSRRREPTLEWQQQQEQRREQIRQLRQAHVDHSGQVQLLEEVEHQRRLENLRQFRQIVATFRH